MTIRGAFFGLALLTACSPAATGGSSGSSGSSGREYTPPAVSKAKGGVDKDGTIRYLALGDSLTQGVGADLETGSFPYLLAEKWKAEGCKVELMNVGISGYTAGQVVADQLPNIADFKPSFITFQAGANDVATKVTLSEYKTNVKKVLTEATASGARVVVFAQNEWFRSPEGVGYGADSGEKRITFDDALIAETEAQGAEFIDLRALYKQQADNNEWGPDNIHPLPKSYAAWATELARVIPAPCK